MASNSQQPNIFGHGEWWEDAWRGMPEFAQEDVGPTHSVQVEFETPEDADQFASLTGQTITPQTRSIWYPEAEYGSITNKRWVSNAPTQPQYPVYIISKGRWDSRLTAKSLDRIGVQYHIVIEPQEYAQYASVIDPEKIFVLPFSNLGQGSIPARNWCWEHAQASGAKRHWLLDDNVRWFYRLHLNMKIPVADGSIFRCAEEFTDRYENVAISGFQYFMFASRKTKIPPIYLNTRIYSMILIRNDLRLGVDGVGQWRGRYNEDTDLSLRALKDGHCTVLFNAFLGDKVTTMKMGGGNTDVLYAGTNQGAKENDGRWKMAESLRLQHPDVTKITWKWNRWQHSVDYSGFRKNRLILRPDAKIAEGANNYGMKLELDGAILDDEAVPDLIGSARKETA